MYVDRIFRLTIGLGIPLIIGMLVAVDPKQTAIMFLYSFAVLGSIAILHYVIVPILYLLWTGHWPAYIATYILNS